MLVVGALLLPDDRGSGLDSGTPSPSAVAPSSEPQRPVRTLGLRWRAVLGARAYNVILWREGKRVLDLWPTKANVAIPARRLRPGTYDWFVYPIMGGGGEQRFGALAGHGTIRV